MKVVVYIPARLNSTRLPGKVLRPFLGVPLVVHCINNLRPLMSADVQVVVNTPSSEVIVSVMDSGHNVGLYLRPESLSQDSTTTEEILSDFVTKYCTDEDYVLVVNPTSPMLKCSTIQDVISRLPADNPDSLFSVSVLKKHVIDHRGVALNYRMWGPHPRTQDVSPVHYLNWAFVGWKVSTVREKITSRGDSLYQGKVNFYPVTDVESADIDTAMDWSITESLARYLSNEQTS